MRKKLQPLLYAAVGGLLAAAIAGPNIAIGAGTPANKAVASGSKVIAMGPGTDVELLRATIKTSAPKDLALHVTLECSILTELITGGENSQSSTATGDVRVWIEFDNKIIPINQVSQPARDPDSRPVGDDTDKVTFCNRTYHREVTDTEDQGDNDPDGTDTTHDYIDTKSANAFNWMLLNAGSGTHSIVVKADLKTETAGDAVAEAYVGNRMLIVDPVKMANNASV